MMRYQLAKIVSWAETLHSRKRLQKVVFSLKAAGCPLEAEFYLHHFGPYSEEVARLTDELVREGLLVERSAGNAVGQQFSYSLPEQTKAQMGELERTERGWKMAEELAPFEPLARSLLQADLKDLEVAATMLYFHRQGLNWPEAAAKTCAFKKLPAEGPLTGRAERLARAVEERNGGPAA